MNESTAQANGHQPIDLPRDHFAEEIMRPLIAREVARQLATDIAPEPTWLRYTRAALAYGSTLSLVIIAIIAVAGVLQ